MPAKGAARCSAAAAGHGRTEGRAPSCVDAGSAAVDIGTGARHFRRKDRAAFEVALKIGGALAARTRTSRPYLRETRRARHEYRSRRIDDLTERTRRQISRARPSLPLRSVSSDRRRMTKRRSRSARCGDGRRPTRRTPISRAARGWLTSDALPPADPTGKKRSDR